MLVSKHCVGASCDRVIFKSAGAIRLQRAAFFAASLTDQDSGVRGVCSAPTRKSFTLRILFLSSDIASIAAAPYSSRIALAGDARFLPKSDMGATAMLKRGPLHLLRMLARANVRGFADCSCRLAF